MNKRRFDPEALLGSIETYRQGGRKLSDVFLEAGVNEVSDQELLSPVRSTLRDRPDLVATWQGWSYDKRWSPNPYLDGLEVGHYDVGRQHVRHYSSKPEACADFVLAEVRWVIDHRVIEP